MYDIETFEQLIKSNLTSEEVYEKITEINPIQTKEKYSNNEDMPLAIYVGGVGKEDLVTINNGLYPLKMRFDSEQVYVEFINLIREKLKSSDKTFQSVVFAAVRNLSRNWFHMQNTPEAIENAKLAQLYLEAYKHPARQRDNYAADERIAVVDDENEQIVYGISKFVGTGDLAKCVEVNSVACNLLNFSGVQSVLVQGYFTNYSGVREAHTFPLYKGDSGNYCLLDCMLKKQKEDVLSSEVNFEEGFNFQIPVRLRYPDGREESSYVTYTIAPQKKIVSSKGINI